MEALGFVALLALAFFGAGVIAFVYCLVLSARVRRITERLDLLEKRQSAPASRSAEFRDGQHVQQDRGAPQPSAAPGFVQDEPPEPAPPADPTDLISVAARPELPLTVESPRVESPAAPGAKAPSAADAPLASQGPPYDLAGRFFDPIKTWATTGNVPVKVGVLLSLIGLGFLLGVALEQGWITLTIEVRHILVALFGVLLLVVGWRVRDRNPIYGLSLQGGGIAVLYLTTYVAHAVYDLLPASAAAAVVVAVTVGAGVLAVLEDARSLAVLGIIGGFLAPVLAYSDAEDHVLVFGFYVILSAAIVAVAWFKIWPELNLLGLGFTLGVSVFWLVQRYVNEDWPTTQPLIALLVLLYLTIPLVFAARRATDLRDWRTAPFVFGLPFAGLGLQWLMTGHFEYGTTISSGTLAVILGVFAVVAHRFGEASRALRDVYAALSVAFVAITVPLALDAQYTSVAWVMQGGVLVWFGLRHQRRLATYGGSILQAMGGLSFISHLIDGSVFESGDLTPLLNGYFLGASLIAVVALFSGRLLDVKGDRRDTVDLAWAALVWGVGWWIFAGLRETALHVPADGRLGVSIVFVMISLGGLALAAPVIAWPRLETVAVSLLPALVVFLILALTWQDHPLGMGGWVAWIVGLAMYYSVLRVREGSFSWAIPAMHSAGYWVVAILVATEVHWQVDRVASGAWPISVALLAVLALAGGTLLSRLALNWPLVVHWRTYLLACAGPVILALGLVALSYNLTSDGDASPLTYLPLLNPLELVTILVAVVVLAWKKLAVSEPDVARQSLARGNWAPPVAVVGIVLLAMVVGRTVHHWAGVPFDFDTMVDSTTLQASLSIVWGLTGLAGMVMGVRLARRIVWVGGASLMGVVVAKLFLFDLSNTGTVARVVSFLGVGLLLLVVGYFAPVPPSVSAQDVEPHAEVDSEGSG